MSEVLPQPIDRHVVETEVKQWAEAILPFAVDDAVVRPFSTFAPVRLFDNRSWFLLSGTNRTTVEDGGQIDVNISKGWAEESDLHLSIRETNGKPTQDFGVKRAKITLPGDPGPPAEARIGVLDGSLSPADIEKLKTDETEILSFMKGALERLLKQMPKLYEDYDQRLGDLVREEVAGSESDRVRDVASALSALGVVYEGSVWKGAPKYPETSQSRHQESSAG